MQADARTGVEISQVLEVAAENKSRQGFSSMILFGMLAGVYIGFGAVAATSVTAYSGLPKGISNLLGGLVFCLGLILVVIPGSELFTGNILMAAGLTTRKVSLWQVLRHWLVVYAGNFLGAMLLALAVYGTGLMGTPEARTDFGARAATIASVKIAIPFGPALMRGILCNMLVCLAVIITVAARSVEGKIAGILFPITTFVMCGFEHSVANMYFLPAGLLANGALGGEFWTMFRNLIPVTIGNILGGLLVVGLHPARARRLVKMVGGTAGRGKRS